MVVPFGTFAGVEPVNQNDLNPRRGQYLVIVWDPKLAIWLLDDNTSAWSELERYYRELRLVELSEQQFIITKYVEP